MSELGRRGLLVAVLVTGAIVRLWGLNAESFWHDESWTWGLTHGGPVRLIDSLIHQDAHPPLYYLVALSWSKIWGTSEVAYRLLSALLGISTLPLLHRLTHRLIGEHAALLATLFLAISPFHVYFSQEARSYPLFFLLALVATNLLFDLHETPTRKKWIGFAVATAGIMFTHYMGAFFIMGLVAAAILLARQHPGFLKSFLIACGGAFLLFLPWLPIFIPHVLMVGESFWIPSPTPGRIIDAFYRIIQFGYHPNTFQWAIVLSFPFYVAAFVALYRAGRKELAALALLLAVPIAANLLVSLVRPVFYTRTLICVLIPLFPLAAAGILRLPGRWKAGAAVLCAGLLVPGLYFQLTVSEKEDWRAVEAILAESARPDELVIVEPGYVAASLEYYASRNGDAWLPRLRRVNDGTLNAPGVPRDEIELEAAAAPGVWVVFRYGGNAGWFKQLKPSFERRFSWSRLGAEVHYFRKRKGPP